MGRMGFDMVNGGTWLTPSGPPEERGVHEALLEENPGAILDCRQTGTPITVIAIKNISTAAKWAENPLIHWVRALSIARHLRAIVNEGRIYNIFETSIALKGLHAILEVAGGLLFALVSTDTVKMWVAAITRDELLEDPRDLIANALLHTAQSFSLDTRNFYAFYLLSHGVIKLTLAIGLWRGKLWSYPASLVALVMFIAYQLYRFSYTQSWALIALTLFDLLFIWLVWHEWRRVASAV